MTYNLENFTFDEDDNGDLVISHNTNGTVFKYDETADKITPIKPFGDTTHDSVSTDVSNNRVQVSPSDDIQAKIDDAGAGGIVEYEDGVYNISSQLSPIEQQTHDTGLGAVFEPSGDTTVFDFSDVFDVSTGPIRIRDPNKNSTSQPAVLFDSVRRCDFGPFLVTDYFNGFEFDTTASGQTNVWNNWSSLTALQTRNRGAIVQGETHDNIIQNIFLDGASGSDSGLVWATDFSGVDGGNYIGNLLVLEHANHGFEVQSGEEVWIGRAVLDVCGNNGLAFTGAFEEMFIGLLWSSTNDNNGVGLNPGAGNTVESLHVNQAYTWQNNNAGWLGTSGTVDNLWVGNMTTHTNDQAGNGKANLEIANTFDNSFIGYLRSFGGNGVAVSGTVNSTHIGRENVDDGIPHNVFTSVNGDPQPEDLTARTGSYESERAYHDGTDGTNTNRSEPATWTGADWEGEISNSIID